MKPVIAELLTEKEQHKGSESIERSGRESMRPGPGDHRIGRPQRHQCVDEVLSDQKVGQRGEIGAPIVSTPPPGRSDQRFESRQRDDDRDRIDEDQAKRRRRSLRTSGLAGSSLVGGCASDYLADSRGTIAESGRQLADSGIGERSVGGAASA